MRQVGNVLAFYTRADVPSNHFMCNFSVRNTDFSSMEQFLMYTKAMYFGDWKIAKKILEVQEPQEQKILGRYVRPYIDEEWCAKRYQFYCIGLLAKYRQNSNLKQWLLSTGDLILAEASERDLNWGTGFKESDDRIGNPLLWRGDNLCGKGNMLVREILRKEMAT